MRHEQSPIIRPDDDRPLYDAGLVKVLAKYPHLATEDAALLLKEMRRLQAARKRPMPTTDHQQLCQRSHGHGPACADLPENRAQQRRSQSTATAVDLAHSKRGGNGSAWHRTDGRLLTDAELRTLPPGELQRLRERRRAGHTD